MLNTSVLPLALLTLTPTSVSVAGDAEHKEIERAVLDYAESYYEVNTSYVERSIHPDLAKIGYVLHEGQWATHPMDYDGFMGMVTWHRDNERVPDPGPKEVVVLDAMDQTALVQLTGSWGIDYMHLARFDGRWQTRHVVWQTVPVKRPAEEIEKDRKAVERAARNYLDGLYEARPELIDKSVHADLVKLGFARKSSAEEYRHKPMTQKELVALARKRMKEGYEVPADAPREVEVLGVMDRVACVKLTATWGVDYMNLTKEDDGAWMIRQVIWQTVPAEVPGR